MERFVQNLRWRDAPGALAFHGQYSDKADIYKLTNVFEIAELYHESSFSELKLCAGYVWAGFTKQIAQYSGGYYLLTLKGQMRQSRLLDSRNLTPRDVWVLGPEDPRNR